MKTEGTREILTVVGLRGQMMRDIHVAPRMKVLKGLMAMVMRAMIMKTGSTVVKTGLMRTGLRMVLMRMESTERKET